MKYLLLLIIKIYQTLISPVIFGKHVCRFTPTCSEYAKQSITKHGIIKGGYLTIKRILNCNPFGKSGFDPVP